MPPAMEALSPLRNSLQSNMRSEMPALKKASSDRNIAKVVLGDLLFDTWYGSFYPDELVGGGKNEVDRLYVCRWCFKYSRELMPYMAHVVSSFGPTMLSDLELIFAVLYRNYVLRGWSRRQGS